MHVSMLGCHCDGPRVTHIHQSAFLFAGKRTCNSSSCVCPFAWCHWNHTLWLVSGHGALCFGCGLHETGILFTVVDGHLQFRYSRRSMRLGLFGSLVVSAPAHVCWRVPNNYFAWANACFGSDRIAEKIAKEWRRRIIQIYQSDTTHCPRWQKDACGSQHCCHWARGGVLCAISTAFCAGSGSAGFAMRSF